MLDIFKKKRTSKHTLPPIEPKHDFDDVSIIAQYFKSVTGVTFEKQTSILKNKVTTFCKLRHINSFEELLALTKQNKTSEQELIDYLTTNETFFYREFKQIQELTRLILDSPKHATISILCAPCATGEEPYSIAIALLEAGVEYERFSIIGIDINSEALERAKNGRYRERNIRNLSERITERYFTKEDKCYILDSRVKSKVDFKIINIFDPSFLHVGRFDYIFSRNMLIYFDKETKQKAKEILESLRKDDESKIFFGHADLF